MLVTTRLCDRSERDIQHGGDVETTEIRIGSTTITLDMCAQHRSALITDLEVDVPPTAASALEAAVETTMQKLTAPTAGTKTAKKVAAARKGSSQQADARVARKWLKDHGYTVPARGKIPGDLLQTWQSGRGSKAA